MASLAHAHPPQSTGQEAALPRPKAQDLAQDRADPGLDALIMALRSGVPLAEA